MTYGCDGPLGVATRATLTLAAERDRLRGLARRSDDRHVVHRALALAPEGRTPVLTGSGRHRDEASTSAAISAAPRRRRVGLYWRADPRRHVDAAAVVAILRDLLRHLRGKVVVVRDGGSDPKGPLVREIPRRYPRLGLERSPGHAPGLDPMERVRAHLKHGRMANFVPRHVKHLEQVVRAHLSGLGGNPGPIRSLWAGSKLSHPDKNPTT